MENVRLKSSTIAWISNFSEIVGGAALALVVGIIGNACPCLQQGLVAWRSSATRQREGRSDDRLRRQFLQSLNWLLGSGFCRSRCWLGYHNRIRNRLRNIDGFRAGLMSTNHARPP